MGREARRVPKDWEHPRDTKGGFIPLKKNHEAMLTSFMSMRDDKGLDCAIDWWGSEPDPDDYMLVGVPDEEKTHFMMYEDTTEGTPISPACSTREELARYLSMSEVCFSADIPATYEKWLDVVNGGLGLPVIEVKAGERLNFPDKF